MYLLRFNITIAFLALFSVLYGQSESSSDIYHELEKFKSPYRVLYVAAHPDDENTRLISYFSNELNLRMAYLSITRGDGGQNLIGNEKGALLGVLRTEELISARKIDGGEQFFTRAVDFGYSKTSKETFNFWGKNEILSDVVYIMRWFKPHIIINRFPPTSYGGHGHHTASALLSAKAFEISSDSNQYSEQLTDLEVWQSGTLYLNSSTWWDSSLVERAKNDLSISVINVGTYNKLLGYSYNELAAYSRSQHKSQGFGSAPSVGDQFEYLEFTKGNFEPGNILQEGLLDSIDKKWLRLNPMVDSILSKINYTDPSNIVSDLIELREQASILDTISHRFKNKIEALDQIILNCLGFSIELISESEKANRGENLTITVKAINRSNLSISLQEINCDASNHSWSRALENNVLFEDTFSILIDSVESYSNPYWLTNEYEYRFNHEQKFLQNPGNQPYACKSVVSIQGTEISFEVPIKNKWTDRVNGGMEKNIALLPELMVEFDNDLYMPKDSIIRGSIKLTSYSHKNIEGYLSISQTPKMNFEYSGSSAIKSGESVYSEFKFSLDLNTSSNNTIEAWFITSTDTFSQKLSEINYDHVEPQPVLLPANAKIVPVELNHEIGKIAYVEGPDNEMIEYLLDIGCEIEVFTEEDLTKGKLEEYNILLFGIRSINVHPSWDEYSYEIQDFIKAGGLVIMQYQTSRGTNPIKMSPYAFNISRSRVTNENAIANWSKPNHPIFNHPFKLSREDFNGWNQERGLYFADKWDENFTTILSWHDDEELDSFGGIIIGDYGNGAFIYTGISFFRHIPNGVPGSYKLFLNLLSYKSE